MTISDTINDAAADIADSRRDVGVHVTWWGEYEKDSVAVELTRMAHQVCGGCGQGLSTEAPGPVDWIDTRTGAVIGGHSHQHGCGEWNSPVAVDVDLDEAFTIDLEEDGADYLVAVSVAAAFATALTDLDDAVTAQVDAEEGRIRRDLLDELDDAMRELADGANPKDVETGGEVEPGVCRESDGTWSAWAYRPQPQQEGDPIIVTQADLANTAR